MTSKGRVQGALVCAAPYLALAVVAAVFMHGWWNGALPADPRMELTVEMGHIWRWQWWLKEGLAAWNHLALTGAPLLTTRDWPFYLALALGCLKTGVSLAWVLKIAHLVMAFLGGWGMMAFARRLEVGRPGAWVGALVYMLWPMRVFVTVDALVLVMNWAAFPWSLWAYERLRGAGSWRSAVRWGTLWGAIVAGMALTAVQMFLMEAEFLAVYMGLRELAALVQRKNWRVPRAPLLGLAVAGAVTVGLTVFFYLPAVLEHQWSGLRRYLEAWPRETELPAPLPLLWDVLWARLSPQFAPMSTARYMHFPDFTFYLSWGALLLALMGFTIRRRRADGWCLMGLGIFSFLLAVGPGVPYNPVYWVVRRVPVAADTVRYSYRALIGVSVGVAGLAAASVDKSLAHVSRRAWRWGLAGALGLLLLADFWPGSLAYQAVPQYLYPDEIAIHQWIDAQGAGTRYWVPIQAELDGWHYVHSAAVWRYNRRPVLADDALQPSTSPWPALRIIEQALSPKGGIENLEKGVTPLGQTALSLAAARYGLVHRGEAIYEEVVARLVAHRGWRVLRQTEHLYLLENPGARPYLQAYRQGALVQGGEEGFPLEWLPGCLERGYALVEGAAGEGPWAAAGEGGCASLPSVGEAEVHLEGGPPVRDVIRVRVQADEGFVLMVAESWYPHWHVEVDGREVPLLRVNGGFLGVAVPAGEHGVRFVYRAPAYQWVCLAVSGLTLLATIVLLVVARREV